MRKIFYNNKYLNTVALTIGLIFVVLATYACFFKKQAPLDILIIVILLFGTGVIVTIIDMKSKHKGMFAKKEGISNKQSLTEIVCGSVFGLCSLWASISGKVTNNSFIRVVLFLGFLFFFVGSIWLLVKRGKGSDPEGNEVNISP